MTIAEKLYEKAQRLPENLQLETLHYMDFLSQKYHIVEASDNAKNTQSPRRPGRLAKAGRTLDPAFFEPLDERRVGTVKNSNY